MATEERLKILKMIERGKITAEEGARLLESLGRAEHLERRRLAVDKSPQRFRVRISDVRTGEQRVDLTLPLIMLAVGTKMGANFAPEGIDIDEIMTAVREGTMGKIVEYVDEEKGERLEFFVD